MPEWRPKTRVLSTSDQASHRLNSLAQRSDANSLGAIALALDRSGSLVASTSTGGRRRASAANRHREALDVLAHSIAPASRRASAVGKVCAGLGVALVEPQHPVGGGFGEEPTVRLAVGSAVADAVEVALPCGEGGGECGIVALALDSDVSIQRNTLARNRPSC